MATRKFNLRDILSVTTSRRLSSTLDGFQGILDFMTGENLFGHQLSMVVQECKVFLLQKYPELANAGTPENLAKLDTLIEDSKHHEGESPETAVEMWLKWMAEPGTLNLKMEYEVEQLPDGVHQKRDPVKELCGKFPDYNLVDTFFIKI